eukprot:CAMPEP_0172507700 /NCGR_PEP_ID=MMETSP1066-20121228/205777_1 /TAXON_ID=671091 /ORGANISM="Coscinodiscus wailesii, Strain CCMP2513" /LENGTH=141 /DNA_ID=CAMNT_0013285347 /DNA_START=507 /DNA_END=932 /DNA_ORIENTATION=-
MVLASQTARFGLNGIDVGFFCSTPSVALSRVVNSPSFVFEMAATGELVSAERALQMGLVNRVVVDNDDGALEDEVKRLSNIVAKKYPVAMRMGKKGFYEQLMMSPEAAYAHATEVMVKNLMCDGTQAGIDSFIKKKEHKWD